MNQRHFGRKAEAILSEEEPVEKFPDSYKERPATLFRNSITSASLVAPSINGKYVNALPPERQSKAYKCNGINLSTNTMANRVIKSTDSYLSLIYDRMHQLIYDSRVIHADETPVKTMRIDNTKIKMKKLICRSITSRLSNR